MFYQINFFFLLLIKNLKKEKKRKACGLPRIKLMLDICVKFKIALHA